MTSQNKNIKKRQTYSKEFCLKLKNSFQQLPADLDADALSDLSESAFFDRGSRSGASQIERNRQHSALIAPSLPLGPGSGVTGGMGRGRGKFGPPPGGAVTTAAGATGGSRFFDTSSSSSSSVPAQHQSAFASSSSPSRHTFLQPRRTSFAEDRWDSRKVAAPPVSPSGKAKIHSALLLQDGPDRAHSVPNTVMGAKEGSKEGRWGGRSGTSSGGGGVSAADEGDWRARKPPPQPRFDWADGKSGSLQSHQNGQSGLQSRGKGSSLAPEWADEDVAPRMSVTAQEIEEERQRLQAQWRKGGGTAQSAAEASMQELIDDDEIERWKKEAEEQDAAGQKQASQPPQQMPLPQPQEVSTGQHVDLNSLFGKGIQPQPPAFPAVSPRINEQQQEQQKQLQSKFETLFSLQSTPMPSMGPPVGPPAGPPVGPPVGPPGYPPPPSMAGNFPPPQDGQDAGKLLLAMLQKSGGQAPGAGASRPPPGPGGPAGPPLQVPPVPPPGFLGPNPSMGSLPYPPPHMMPPHMHHQRPPAPPGHFPPLPVSQYPPEYHLQGAFPPPARPGSGMQQGGGPIPLTGGGPPVSMQYMPQFQMQQGPHQAGGQFVSAPLPQQQSQLLAQLFAGAGVAPHPPAGQLQQMQQQQQQQYTSQQLAQLEALRARAAGPPSSMGMGMGMGMGMADPNQNQNGQPIPLQYMQSLGMRPPQQQ